MGDTLNKDEMKGKWAHIKEIQELTYYNFFSTKHKHRKEKNYLWKHDIQWSGETEQSTSVCQQKYHPSSSTWAYYRKSFPLLQGMSAVALWIGGGVGSISFTPGTDLSLHSFPVFQIETSLGLLSSGQRHCQLQGPKLYNTCAQASQIRPPAVNGDRALITPFHSPPEFLSLTPAPSHEESKNKTIKEIKNEFLKSLDAYEGKKEIKTHQSWL